jgi:hypothetical protein
MSERDEVRELLANPPGLLGQLAELGRIHRERCEWGLAAAESDELGEELAEEEVPLRWAAADTEELPLPVRYQGEGIELVVGLDENGPYICVVAGGPLQIPLLGLQLGTGEEAAFTMERAPASVVVVVGGQSLRLSGRSVGEPGER